MPNHDSLISKIFFNNNGRLAKKYFKLVFQYRHNQKYQNIHRYLTTRYSDSGSLKETLYRIKHHIDIRPICKICRGKVKFVGKGDRLFGTYCSKKCLNNDVELWKVKHDTDKAKHGGKLGWNVSYENNVKYRKITLENRFGTYDNAVRYMKYRQKESVVKKYGVTNVMKVKEFKDKWLASLKKNNPNIGTSIQETSIYNAIKQKHLDVKFHYTNDPRYPFECDFYIPSLDLFIEYQGHQTHGGHPYDKDNPDDQSLAKWIKQIFGSNLTFIKRDPYKRHIAKKNNLNFIELWNMKDAKKFINEKL